MRKIKLLAGFIAASAILSCTNNEREKVTGGDTVENDTLGVEQPLPEPADRTQVIIEKTDTVQNGKDSVK